MKKGLTSEADVLAKKIGLKIAQSNSKLFSKDNKNNNRGSRELWDTVRSLTGKTKHVNCNAVGVNAGQLNQFFASFSTDVNYVTPETKYTSFENVSPFLEFVVFSMLDKLRPTSPGLDNLPNWFLRLAAPCLAKPVAHLYNLSLTRSTLPKQWKISIITPVPKKAAPKTCEEFRPISVTPILSRILEKFVVRQYLYPIMNHPEYTALFADQFAFRPTGSTTAALINLLQQISVLLLDDPYVHVIALDFSKAFDTVRHGTLIQKLANFPLPDFVHNWFVDYLDQREHCTKFNHETSTVLQINASIVQGSGIGPCAFVFNASDLHPVNTSNSLNKYADDTYLVVPARNTSTIPSEMKHISEWAMANNLKLNTTKSLEMIVRNPWAKKNDLPNPPPQPGIERVDQMVVLGVNMQSNLKFDKHVDKIVNRAAQTFYALRVLRSHGLTGPSLWDVARSTMVSQLLYATPAWWGFVDEEGKNRIQSIIKKAKRQGFLPVDFQSFEQCCQKADDNLFRDILNNSKHVLHFSVPPVKSTGHDLRPRVHNRTIPKCNDTTLRKNFLYRLLYKDIY
jgi:hypothetical protein